MNRELKTKHLKAYLKSAKKRAEAKQLPFDLDLEYLESIAMFRCPVFLTKLTWGEFGKGAPTSNSPSLDRIVPDKGYVKGNVRFLSNLANSMKQNATQEQLLLFANWVNGITQSDLREQERQRRRDEAKQSSNQSTI